MKRYTIALIPGDGIGTEVAPEGVRVLEAAAARFGFSFDWTACGDGGCDEGCEHWAEIPFDRIGGFVFEPGSAAGRVQVAPDALVR